MYVILTIDKVHTAPLRALDSGPGLGRNMKLLRSMHKMKAYKFCQISISLIFQMFYGVNTPR